MALGQRSGRALVEALKRTPPTNPGFHFSTLLAGILALLVQGMTIFFLAVGIWWFTIFLQWGNWLALIGAIILFGIVWLTRPRFVSIPPTLPRNEFPALYTVVDQVADALGSPKVAGIAITPEFNASLGRYGLQQKTVLVLGLPLFFTIKGQEKIALIAHELAHGVSGDPLRLGWLQIAIRTLQQWVYLLRPQSQSNVGRGTLIGSLVDISSIFTTIAGFVVEKIVYALMYVLSILTYRNSQRAEYRADYLSAQAGGTNGALSALDKSYLASNFYSLVQRVALGTDKTSDLFTEFERYSAALPPREKERLHRATLMEGSRLDVSHPPTAHRIEVLQAHPVHLPKVTLSPDVEKQMEQELTKLRLPVQRDLLENFRHYMYY